MRINRNKLYKNDRNKIFNNEVVSKSSIDFYNELNIKNQLINKNIKKTMYKKIVNYDLLRFEINELLDEFDFSNKLLKNKYSNNCSVLDLRDNNNVFKNLLEKIHRKRFEIQNNNFQISYDKK